MNRRQCAVGGLVLLVLLSGCTLFGGGEISQDELTEPAEYDWETNATAAYNVTTEPMLSFSSNEYQAVITVADRETLSIHRETLFRGDRSVSIEALQFRFENGTVVNATHAGLTATEESDETVIELPATNGTVGYTADWGSATGFRGSPRTWRVQTPVEGTHTVTMPEGARTTLPLLSATRPGGYESTVEDDRVTLTWEEFDGSTISVRYYLVRDLYLFGGLFAVGLVVAIVGVGYYYRAIQRAREQRKAVGLDVEEELEDIDDSEKPPPGMR